MGDLDREKAREIATKIARGDYDRADDAVDALEGCVLPDFRIAALEAAKEDEVIDLDPHCRHCRLRIFRVLRFGERIWVHETGNATCALHSAEPEELENA